MRLDGRAAPDFDVIDRFVVAHGLDLDVAAEAMALDDLGARAACSSTSTSRARSSSASRAGLTPAKLARVIGLLDPGRADARAEEAPRAARTRRTRRTSRT